MEPVTLTTERLLLRTVGSHDVDALYAACQDPDIQRWTLVPSPYRREHAHTFATQQVPEGWRSGTMFNLGVFLRTDTSPEGGPATEDSGTGRGQAPAPREGDLVAMVGISARFQSTGEIGFWAAKEHRGHGYVAEAGVALSRWAFTSAGFERLEWRAEVGNHASRAAARKTGFTMEGTLRSALSNKGVRRDCWVGSLLPHDLGLPSAEPYVPAPSGRAA
jgi:RimJ/RimL family protein N-acetyltransferase